MKLDGNVAAATGGAAGIGQAICLRLAATAVASPCSISNRSAAQQAAARVMVARGSGAIVNMASVYGIEGCTGHPHYSAAKAGIIGFTRSVAKELILQGVRINAVAPGFIDTATLHDQLDETRREMALKTPAGRLGTPEEVAATVAFLLCEDSSYFVGATLSPNRGLVTAA
jgi:NAD(P)-dependent dehydrogenase (short-subunit alcohol dehydrogenase family)